MSEQVLQSMISIVVALLTAAGVVYKTRIDARVKRDELSFSEISRIVEEYQQLSELYKQRWEETERKLAELDKELDEVRTSLEQEIKSRDVAIHKLIEWSRDVIEIARRHGIQLPPVPSDTNWN